MRTVFMRAGSPFAAPVPGGGGGSTLGTPDPTLLPQADLTAFPITAIDPDYTAFNALSPRTQPAGWYYTDPVTGVTVVKLSEAGTPTASSCHGWYSDGGATTSHAWQSGADWYVTIMVYSDAGGQTAWVADLKITGTPTLSAWRTLTGQLAPSELGLSFSSNPATPQIAYIVSGGTLRRCNLAAGVMAVQNTGNFPRTTGTSGPPWMHQDKNDEWFVFGTGNSTQYAWNANTNVLRTAIYNANELRIDRDGGYGMLGFTSASQSRLWNFVDDTYVGLYTQAVSHEFAHNASMRNRWMGTNWNASRPFNHWIGVNTKAASDALTMDLTGTLSSFFDVGEIHMAAQWVQYPANLDHQWCIAGGSSASSTTNRYGAKALGIVRADGQDIRILGHHYHAHLSANYWDQNVWVNWSAGGHVVTCNTRLASSQSNENTRTDVLAFILPRSGGI